MAERDFETVVIGGGAAGIAAARHLQRSGVKCVIVEARPRLGGRAWTIADPSGNALDLGCGWLHSADRNPWVAVAEEQRRTIDKTPPPWARATLPYGFRDGEQHEFRKAQEEFFARVGERAQREPDVPAAALFAVDVDGTTSSAQSAPTSVAPNLIVFRRATSTILTTPA